MNQKNRINDWKNLIITGLLKQSSYKWNKNARYVTIKNGYVNGDGIYCEIFTQFASDVTFPEIDNSNMYSTNEKVLTSIIVRNNKRLSACIVDLSCMKRGFYDLIGKVYDLNELKEDELNLLKENYEFSKNCIYIKTSWERPSFS
ncbi:MAG: hypothetical protein ACI9P5_002583 [Saprospiraceae bacterium]